MKKIDLKSIVSSWKNLDPQKIWTWPAIPKYAVLSGICVLFAAGGYFTLVGPEIESLDQAQLQMETLKKEYQDKYTMSANLEAYKKLRKNTEVVFGESLRQLPSKSEMEALLNDINQAGLGRGLSFESFKPNPKENTFEFYAELPIAMTVEGSYHDIAEFNAAIAKLARIVTINDIELKLIDPKNNGSKEKKGPAFKMKMVATAKTYRYLDDTEVKEQQKAKQAANKGRPTTGENKK